MKNFVITSRNIGLKGRLRKKELTIGSWITLASPEVAEIMSTCDFDWLTVDMEHSAITLPQAQHLIRIIQLNGIAALVRVGENSPALIKRVMDLGADGVIIPMVNSPQDAKKAVAAVKYPPLGNRGVGLARAQGYGLEFEKYKDWVKEESVVIVQIEHIKAVDNLEDILKVKGVDGFIVGPYDLSASLGLPGEFKHPNVLRALDKVEAIVRKGNIVSGFHVIPPDIKEVKNKLLQGYRFIGFSLDTLFLGLKIKEEFGKLKRTEL